MTRRPPIPNRALCLAAGAVVLALPALAQTEAAVPSEALLTPDNHTLILIDHQPQMAFAANSMDTTQLINNVTLVAKAADLFEVPTVLTTVAETTFSGPIFPAVQAVFPDVTPIDRTSMNSWEDPDLVAAVEAHGHKRIVIAALWTEVCGVYPSLSALDQDYEVYFLTDASAGMSDQIHDAAVDRMVQAGVVPISSMQYLLELQRDWARSETYDATNEIVKVHGGAYGLGVLYAKEMFGASEGG